MPKFKITTNTGQSPESYDEALEFPHVTAAEHDAQVALTEMCRDGMPHDRSAEYGVRIEDDSGKQVYRAALHFEAERDETKPTVPDIAGQSPYGPKD